MAEMHPADIENYNYTLSEKYVYEAFRDQLEKKYHVFYSVRWFEVEEGKRVDSESDFIVFDPSFGFITIEVKGGKDIIQEGEHWFLIENKDGEETTRELKCSPYEQAEKACAIFISIFMRSFINLLMECMDLRLSFPGFPQTKLFQVAALENLQLIRVILIICRERLMKFFIIGGTREIYRFRFQRNNGNVLFR